MIWVGKIQEAIDYIEANLFEPINAEVVGKAINYAPSSFSNFFSAVVGYSVGEYIRFRRLSIAAERFVKGDVSVTDMAFECGFETVESFSKAFKRMFGCTPSQFAGSEMKYTKFTPISINFSLKGGFSMTRNLIPGLQKVDWSDPQRQSEFVNSVVSALNGLGEKLDYDYVCAVSGSAFRTSFSKEGWNFGNYNVINVPIIIEHTFKMLGYQISHHIGADYETYTRLIVDSIDRGAPVITIESAVNGADACVVYGYDLGGAFLLDYSPPTYYMEDHPASIIIIGEKREKPPKEILFNETLKIIKRLISEETMVPGQYNGLTAHKAFASALERDGFKISSASPPYLHLHATFLRTYKMYLDRQYAVKFFEDNGRNDLAGIYKEIAELCAKLGQAIPQRLFDIFGDKNKPKPYCDMLLKICELEKMAAERMRP